MKTLFISIFLFCLSLSFINSAPINRETAMKVAKYYMAERYAARGMEIPLIDIKSIDAVYDESNENILVYVVNTLPKGFVLVSADDRVWPVLGYSLQFNFDINYMAPATKYWMKGYTDQISYSIKQQLNAEDNTIAEWNKLTSNNPIIQGAPKSNVVVGPLITAIWNQDKYYNRLCPEDAAAPTGYDGRVPNGCVALSTSLVMYYHRYPETGTGTHSYYASGYGTQSANYGATTYQWDAMTDEVNNYNTSVAKLIYHLGVAVNMNYAADGSGSQTDEATNALETYFKYSNTITTKNRWSYSNASWMTLMKDNLNLSRPMVYSGSDQASGGHAFNCDGYDDADYFHFNWGWGGYANGYYLLTNLNPQGSTFNSGQQAIVNIFPSNPVTSCSALKTLTSSTGSIADYSGSENYGNNQDCQWLIAPENAGSISIVFAKLNTESVNDVITIYNGESTSSPVVGTYSGTTLPTSAIAVAGPKALVRFQTNATVVNKGFHLNYTSTNAAAFCTSTKLLTTSTGSVSDGSASDDYNNNTYCRWFIQPAGATSITLTFSSFNVSAEDEVFIYNRSTNPITLISKYSGSSLPPVIVCPAGRLGIEFVTDNMKIGEGWEASWTSTGSSSGIQQMDGILGLSIFPNPSIDELNIQINSDKNSDANLTITDIMGKVVYSEAISITEIYSQKINISSFNKGMYFLNLKNDSGSMIVKFIKQ